MIIDIVSITKEGRFLINHNSEYAKTLYKLAKYDIESIGFLTSEYADTLDMASDKLNLLVADPEAAQADFDNMFFHNYDGLTYELYPMMVWNIAWSVYLLSDLRIANANHFFECNRTLLLDYKASHAMVEYTQQLNKMKYDEQQKRASQVPACVAPQIKKIDNKVSVCRKGANAFSDKIGTLEDDFINQLKRDQALMENKYQAALTQVAEEAREALVAAGKELEATRRKLEKSQAELEKANEELAWLSSEDYRTKVGIDSLVQVVLNEIAPCEDSDDSVARRKQYESLAPIVLKIDGFPKEVTERVLALAVTPQSHEHKIYVGELNGTLNAPDKQTINNYQYPVGI